MKQQEPQQQARLRLLQQQLRFKSSRAAVSAMDSDDSDDDEDAEYLHEPAAADALGAHAGHAAAAAYRAQAASSPSSTVVDESWMINLGRGTDNDWLMGPRDPRQWFTGPAPAVNHQEACPGK